MAQVTLPKSMDDVEATREFKVAPAGEYEFEVKKAEMTKTRNGDPMIKFRYSIVNDEEWTGTGVFDQAVLTDDGLFRLKQISLATGVEIGDEFDTEDFVGAEFSAVINVGSYTNKQGEEVENNEISKYIFDE